MNTVLYQNGIRYVEKQFKNEAEVELLVVGNARTLFGQNTLYVDTKKKIDNSTFGGVIPDGSYLGNQCNSFFLINLRPLVGGREPSTGQETA